MYGFKFLCEMSKGTFEFPHKMLNQYTAKYASYCIHFFCLWVTISLNCDVICLSETEPKSAIWNNLCVFGGIGTISIQGSIAIIHWSVSMFWFNIQTNISLYLHGYIHNIKPGCMFLFEYQITWERFKPMREDVTYVTSSLIGWNRSHVTWVNTNWPRWSDLQSSWVLVIHHGLFVVRVTW